MIHVTIYEMILILSNYFSPAILDRIVKDETKIDETIRALQDKISETHIQDGENLPDIIGNILFGSDATNRQVMKALEVAIQERFGPEIARATVAIIRKRESTRKIGMNALNEGSSTRSDKYP